MADRINRNLEKLNDLLKQTTINKGIAINVTEILYSIESQLSKDYKLIKNRILSALNEVTNTNIEIKKVEIEAILLTVEKQFEERKANAAKNLYHAME